MCRQRKFKVSSILLNALSGELRVGYYAACIHFHAHLLDPRSRRELAFDMPVDGENAMGEENPERGSAAKRRGGVRGSLFTLKFHSDKPT